MEGLDDEIGGKGWHKVRAFGHVCYAKRVGPDGLLLAMRIGNVPLGVPFHRTRAWAMLDVVVDYADADDRSAPAFVSASAASSDTSTPDTSSSAASASA